MSESLAIFRAGEEKMQKPSYMAVATAVFMAGISNAFIYTLGYVAMVAIQFVFKGGGGASFGSATTAFIISLMFTLLLSSIITFLLAFPIAVICRKLGFVGSRAFIVAPAVGAALACWIASVLDVAMSTYVAIIAFAYITAAIMWLALGRSSKAEGSQAAAQPAS
jgi:hypothetical protein